MKAYSNGLTPSKLIEGFLGDLLDGTYSHGSDERDLADEYFERCSYDMGLERSFLHWALNGGWYDELEEAIIGQDYMLEQLEYAKTVKGLSKKQIQEGIDTCNTLSVVIKPYMDRLIKMQANATRSSAASLMATVKVLSENYIDNATPEEILANALRLSTAITKTKLKSDAEYLAEAKEWIGADLGRPSDGG